MGRRWTEKLTFGSQLTLALALLAAVVLSGNILLSLQFRSARQQTDRLDVVRSQMMAVLRVQYVLLSFHQELDELVASRDAAALVRRSEQLQHVLLEQLQRTARVLKSTSDRRLETRFLPFLDSIEIGFPHQLSAITSLAAAGDWQAVTDRVADQLKPTEAELTLIANEMDAAYADELSRTEQNTSRLQNRITLFIPLMTLLTFSAATLLVWAIARRIITLRINERLGERMRISRDLHDTLLQGVQGLVLQFHVAAQDLPEGSSTRTSMERALVTADRIVAEGRDRVTGLRAAELTPIDLRDAFEALAADLNQEQRVRFVLAIADRTPDIASPVLHELYYIGREALSNAFRHAHASEIALTLTCGPRAVVLAVTDNGHGFDLIAQETAPRTGHWGLRGMKERAESIGALFDCQSAAHKGTRVTITVPVRRTYEEREATARSKKAASL